MYLRKVLLCIILFYVWFCMLLMCGVGFVFVILNGLLLWLFIILVFCGRFFGVSENILYLLVVCEF